MQTNADSIEKGFNHTDHQQDSTYTIAFATTFVCFLPVQFLMFFATVKHGFASATLHCGRYATKSTLERQHRDHRCRSPIPISIEFNSISMVETECPKNRTRTDAPSTRLHFNEPNTRDTRVDVERNAFPNCVRFTTNTSLKIS